MKHRTGCTRRLDTRCHDISSSDECTSSRLLLCTGIGHHHTPHAAAQHPRQVEVIPLDSQHLWTAVLARGCARVRTDRGPTSGEVPSSCKLRPSSSGLSFCTITLDATHRRPPVEWPRLAMAAVVQHATPGGRRPGSCAPCVAHPH